MNVSLNSTLALRLSTSSASIGAKIVNWRFSSSRLKVQGMEEEEEEEEEGSDLWTGMMTRSEEGFDKTGTERVIIFGD